MRMRSIMLIVILGFSLIVAFSVIVFFSWTHLLLLNIVKEDEDLTHGAIYEMTEFTSENNDLRRCIVKLSLNLKKNEYISYRDERRKFLVISNFADAEYSCRASCYCTDSRRQAGVLGSGVFLILSAVSTAMATSIAIEYFGKECLNLYSDSCDNINIRPVVDSCTVEESENKENSVEDLTSIMEEDNYGGRRYFCRGYCIPKSSFSRKEAQQKADNFNCKNHEISNEVYITEEEVLNLKQNSYNIRARQKFQRDHLREFCKGVSQKTYKYRYISPTGQKRFRVQTISLCSSYEIGHRNVHCHVLDEDDPPSS